MRVVLNTDHISAPSTVLNKALLDRIDSDFTFNDGFKNKDVILFMGYDPKIDEARKVNKDALIGIIDPRPKTEHLLSKVDFWIANGIEVVNRLIHHNPNYFIYPIYPPIEKSQFVKKADNINRDIVIAYHGNLKHLQEMEQTVCIALERLAKDHKFSLQVVYNFKNGKKWEWTPESQKITIEHIQWREDIYEKVLPKADIGIVPAVKPTTSEEHEKLVNISVIEPVDYIQRYKYTTNMGRILVFAQIEVPVIADMYPSASELIRHGYNGFLAANADSWYWHLKTLIDNEHMRKKMAANMTKVFSEHYHWDIKNKGLLEYFEMLIKESRDSKLFSKMLFWK